MSKKYKKLHRVLDYIDCYIMVISTITDLFSITDFPSSVRIRIGTAI